jgi:dTDP-4-amino-4,6-dideoxygalactose transaminase
MNDLLDRRWLSNHGPYVQEFERRIADRVGVRHCVATPNATVGLEIAIRALGLRGEVVVPSFTFVATAHVLQWLGITPVFCDVEPERLTLDPAAVEALVGPRTTGILGVHLWGRPCDVEALSDIADRHHLRLLFDAAHAFGCSHHGRMVGSFGDAEVFSFHATKFCNAFEGGAIVTNDDDLAATVRLMHNFGFAGYDTVVGLGINGKMNEASAAMGLTSLESLDEFIAANRRNYEQYRRELAGVRGLRVLPFSEGDRHNYQYVAVQVDAAECGISRDDLAAVCWAENVLVRRYFFPGCHRMEPYRSNPPARAQVLPVTERAAEQMLTLPTGTTVGPNDVAAVCALLRFVVNRGPAIRDRLRHAAMNIQASASADGTLPLARERVLV